MNNHMFLFTMRDFRELVSIYVCAPFPFGFEGAMCDLIVLIKYHCLSFYLKLLFNRNNLINII